MKKLYQNPVVRQAHRFLEALLYPAYFVFSLLSLRWVRHRHPRAAGVLSAVLWIELVMRGIKQLVRLMVPVLRDAPRACGACPYLPAALAVAWPVCCAAVT